MQNHTCTCLKSQELFQDTLTLEHLKSNLITPHHTHSFFSFFNDSHKLVKIKPHLRHRLGIHTQSHTTRGIGRGQNMRKMSGVEAC